MNNADYDSPLDSRLHSAICVACILARSPRPPAAGRRVPSAPGCPASPPASTPARELLVSTAAA